MDRKLRGAGIRELPQMAALSTTPEGTRPISLDTYFRNTDLSREREFTQRQRDNYLPFKMNLADCLAASRIM